MVPVMLPPLAQHELLIVADNTTDAIRIYDALKAAGCALSIRIVPNVEEALAFMSAQNAYVPDLIIVDLNFSNCDASNVLRQIRSSGGAIRSVPIVVFSSSDVKGADISLTKPVDIRGFGHVIRMIAAKWPCVGWLDSRYRMGE